MGTNYYWYPKYPCNCCQRPYEAERLHIGKSSVGWCFALHVMVEDFEEPRIESLNDWIVRFNIPGSYIADEYGRVLTTEQMLSWITERSHPRGLLRATHNCVGQGEGTWDLIKGEFS